MSLLIMAFSFFADPINSKFVMAKNIKNLFFMKNGDNTISSIQFRFWEKLFYPKKYKRCTRCCSIHGKRYIFEKEKNVNEEFTLLCYNKMLLFWSAAR